MDKYNKRRRRNPNHFVAAAAALAACRVGLRGSRVQVGRGRADGAKRFFNFF